MLSTSSKSKSKSKTKSKSKKKNDGASTAASAKSAKSQSASQVTSNSPLSQSAATGGADEEVGLSMANAGMMADDDDVMLGVEDPSERKVGSIYKDLNCLCNPTRAKRPGEICSRLGKWCVANANQIVSSIIGEYIENEYDHAT